jgi:hypothetical protein
VSVLKQGKLDSPNTMDSSLQFVLLDMEESLCREWREAFEQHVPENVRTRITVLNEYLERVNFEYDVIVSPANSYGRLDGRCVTFSNTIALILTGPVTALITSLRLLSGQGMTTGRRPK